MKLPPRTIVHESAILKRRKRKKAHKKVNVWSSHTVECQFNYHPSPIPQNAIKITVIGFFSFSTGCSQHHRHLSALIHDKLSHLIHDKSSEGPIETRKLKRKAQMGERSVLSTGLIMPLLPGSWKGGGAFNISKGIASNWYRGPTKWAPLPERCVEQFLLNIYSDKQLKMQKTQNSLKK